ncbi:hypothetical protein [Paenibacillus agricola]|uniref:Uncharacterized protein n=1 Tax=Paenibacillus agricola TaxID=2716264 RepID=A0ABX0J6Q1_9BACL|nr:hypothetical protein [Paenibacillus agricola]NHN32024.1 hypothetical protein [Paenibacillus agricola]
MAKHTSQVPFGYEPENEREGARGSMWVYASFEGCSKQELVRIMGWAKRKEMKQLVLYPLHEETLKRMGERGATSYYRRADGLEAWLEQIEQPVATVIDRFEGRRKKYTPMDLAFRFLEEKYEGPYFVYVTLEMANTIAAFDDFEAWIRKVRLFIDLKFSVAANLHPRLLATAHRWESVE